MTDSYNAVEITPRDADKIKRHLEKIQEAQSNNPELNSAITAAITEFNKFFLNYGKPGFTANKLLKGDPPKSELYNENLETLDEDFNRLYASLAAVEAVSLEAYNYSAIVTNEITNSANVASSKVLDLNIINDFNKGEVIVAGDDFVNSDKIDTTVGVETIRADLLEGAGSISLKRIELQTVSNPNTKVEITPISPAGQAGNVVSSPTPDNLERFYEGKFYAYMGELEPEGGTLDLQYLVAPAAVNPEPEETATAGNIISAIEKLKSKKSNTAVIEANKGKGFYAVVQASEEQKQLERAKMFDNDPSTYWQAEYVYATAPLIDPFEDIVEDEEANTEGVLQGAQVTVDLKSAELLAQKYDFRGRDLIMHVDIILDQVSPVNFVLLNPVLFGTSAFIKITDVATAGDGKDFETVDGFNNQAFDKILTPEANKVIPKDKAEKLLAPSQFSYKGLGVFSFPVRMADKIRVTLSMEEPIPAVYERLHVLTQEKITTKTKTKKKGLF